MKKQSLRFIKRAAACSLLFGAFILLNSQAAQRIEVSFPSSLRTEPITGRLIIAVSFKDLPEPRLAISPYGPQIFGVDVDQLKPGEAVTVDESVLGYPFSSLKDIKNGDYYIQAVMNVYTECRRSDGHTIWVHLDRSRGASFNRSPGNLYSEVKKVHFGSDGDNVIKLKLSRIIPQAEMPEDTEWLKRVWIKSDLLSEFWGHPIYFGATVLLPKEYEKHTDSYYPAVYVFEHGVPFSFSTDPKTLEQRARAQDAGLQTGYEFYQSWIADDFPRFIAVTFHTPTPYFLSSYSVNSANCGPYGDALLQELIPYLEKNFRIIPEPYARLVEGASTGGWEALALQLYHPDYFGGAWVYNPDPIDFRHYQMVNIYEDENAFFIPLNEWRKAERPMRRTTKGQMIDTVRSMSLFEYVLGTHGRSRYQFNGWEAVYGPVGADGYPVPLWDKLTGKINRDVAEYMREQGYDLREYAARNWSSLGPKVKGKLHFFSGEMDNFYLNLSVYLFEDFLKNTSNPHEPGHFEYGRPMKGHNWHPYDWAEMLRRMADYIKKNAPPEADTTAWNY